MREGAWGRGYTVPVLIALAEDSTENFGTVGCPVIRLLVFSYSGTKCTEVLLQSNL